MWPTLFDIPFFNIPVRGYGFMLMIAFLGGTWWAARRALRVKADPDLVVNMGFVALLSSVVGARIFYVVHYWDEHFAGRGLWSIVNVTAGGLEFYGGFIGAFLATVAYLLIRRASVRLYADIVAPSLMFGMGMARIGCFLNGCCWGAPCPAEIPWSVRFPYYSPAFHREWEERHVAIPAELIVVNSIGQSSPLSPESIQRAIADPAETTTASILANNFRTTPAELKRLADSFEYRSLHLHPAQLYASIDGLLLAVLLNTLFYRRKRHGVVFALMLMLYAVQRFIEESIRIDNPHDTAYLTISQFVSILIFAGGVAWYVIVRRLPLRSPRAIPWEPPWQAQPAPATGKAATPKKASTPRK